MKHALTTAACLLATAFVASAQVPSLINYQGRLTDANGSPVTGSKNFAISIYDAATGGNLLYTETIGAVALDANGVYNFQFGGAGTSNTQVTETLATTDGTATTFQKILENSPVVAGSVSVTDGTYTWTQSAGPSNEDEFGVAYSTSLRRVTANYYSGAPAAGRTITATYRYGTTGITGALSSGAEHWMAVTVDGTPQGKRQRVLAVPFALTSGKIKGSAVDVNGSSNSLVIKSGGITFADGSTQNEAFSRQANLFRTAILENRAAFAATHIYVAANSANSGIVAEGFQIQQGSQSLVVASETTTNYISDLGSSERGYGSSGVDGNYIPIPKMDGLSVGGSYTLFHQTNELFKSSTISKISFTRSAGGEGVLNWYFKFNYVDGSSVSTSEDGYGNGYGSIPGSTSNPFPQKPVENIQVFGKLSGPNTVNLSDIKAVLASSAKPIITISTPYDINNKEFAQVEILTKDFINGDKIEVFLVTDVQSYGPYQSNSIIGLKNISGPIKKIRFYTTRSSSRLPAQVGPIIQGAAIGFW